MKCSFKKRALALILAFSMTVGTVPAYAQEAGDVTYDLQTELESKNDTGSENADPIQEEALTEAPEDKDAKTPENSQTESGLETESESESETESETESQTESIPETQSESKSESESETKKDELKELKNLMFSIEGEGDITIYQPDGTFVILDEFTESDDLNIFYSVDTKLKIEASVRDPEHRVSRFITTVGENEPVEEEILDEGYFHEIELNVSEDTKIEISFEKIDLYGENQYIGPASQEEIAKLVVGDQGVTWGMYQLFNGTQYITELGPNGNDPYSHIVQVDPDGDGVLTTYTAYCSQFGVYYKSGMTVVEATLSEAQKDYMGYALAYGWKQSGTSYDQAQYESATARTEFAVTQGVIWCCGKGIFNTASGDSAMAKIISYTKDPAHAQSYYNNLKSYILTANTIPSFASSDVNNPKSYELVWNTSKNRYEITLTDTNGVIGQFNNYQNGDLGVERNGNTVTFYTTKRFPDYVTAGNWKSVSGGSAAVISWDAQYEWQNLVSYRTASHNVYSYIQFKTKDTNGNVSLKKESAIPSITNNNSCYSLAGAQYGVYSDAACKNLVGTLTTKADGTSNEISLIVGTYYVKETVAPKGYALDKTTYTVTVSAGKTNTLKVKDYPQSDPVAILLGKVDKQTNADKPAGSASLEGAYFTVKYYDVQMDTDPAKSGHLPIRTWIIKTNEKGRCYLNNDFKVSGDDFYYQTNGNVTLPLGTITIQETKAPDGYLIHDEVFVRKITTQGNAEIVETYNMPTIPEQVIRGNFQFIKNSEDGKALANVQFKITSKTTGENYVVTSDANGLVTTKNLWFGGGTKDSTLGALPYDTYIVEELECDANFYHQIIAPFEVVIDSNNVNKDLGIIINYYHPEPELGTKAVGQETGIQELPAQGNVTIVDTVTYRNLVLNRKYTIKGILMDKSTGEPLLINGRQITAETTITAKEKNGTVDLKYTFDATGLGGIDVVVFEKLYDAKNKMVASHEDINDVGQTVKIVTPKLGTTATDKIDDDHYVSNTQKETIVDIVYYEGLIPGRTYTMTGTIMVKETNEPLMDDGAKVTSSVNFTPTSPNGSVALEFTFNAKALVGKHLVAFESCSYNGKEIAVHTDINDADQTVEVVPIEIGTTAKDMADGDKYVFADVKMTVVDTVSYKNLVVGQTYTIKGILMDKSTGEPLVIDGKQITSQKVFTADKVNGTVDVEFTFDAVGLGGTQLVVFEELYKGTELLDDHKDINDEGQTVEIVPIEIGTKAADKVDGDQNVSEDVKMTIIDTVTYKNLTPGKEYVMKGVLMDKSTGEPLLVDGKEVRSELTFTAEEPNGEVQLEFTFDAVGMAGTTVVVFETLYREEKEIAVHADIEDKDQTIEIVEIEIGTKAADKVDGDQNVSEDVEMTIIDTVTYKNLTPGKEYVMKGVLMDKSTGEPLLVDGKEVRSELTFTAEEPNGEVQLEFTFDAVGMAGTTVVVFETLYREEKEIAVHADIEDKDQTIEIVEIEIGTKAADKVDNNQYVSADVNITIVDTVTYTNLTPGKEYVMKGVLMDKSTEKPLLVDGKEVRSELTFTPEKPDGKVKLEFTFDAVGLAGKTVIVFETLYREEKEIAVHTDIEDKDQTIEILKPVIKTSASNKVNGSKEIYAKNKVTIVDKVTYQNLQPGNTYTVSGILIDKRTKEPLIVKDKNVTATVTFVPELSCGTVELEFTFEPLGLCDEEDFDVVVFEKLLNVEGTLIAEHQDIEDKEQTVRLKRAIGSLIPDYENPGKHIPTGDTVNIALWTAVCVCSFAVLISFLKKKRKVDHE